MKTSFKTITIRLSVCIFCAMLAATGFAQDKVYQTSGTTLTGEIKALTHNEVLITALGKDRTITVNNIARVSFDGEPAAFGRVKEFASQGQWDQADTELKGIPLKSVPEGNSREDYKYYFALIASQLALSGKGSPTEAVNMLKTYISANKQSHHYYEFSEIYGDLASATGNFDDARKAYSAIAKAPFPEYQLKSNYLQGKAFLDQGKAPEAEAEFQKVKAATATDPISQRYQKLATVAAIRCNIVKGDAKTAVDQLNKLLEENDSSDVPLFANIYNTLGEAHLALKEPGNAEIMYLATDLMFASDADKHAEALYHLGQLWDQTGNPQRATDARTRLKQQYGGSIWAKK